MTWGESWGGLWGGGDVGQDDHIELAIARLPEEFKRSFSPSPNLPDILEVWMGEVNAVECAAFDVKFYRAISTAVGQTLDKIGDNFDLPRRGLNDEAYRCALSVRVRSLFSSGTPNDALEVLDRIMKDDVRARGIMEFFPASFCLFAEDLTDAELELFPVLLGDIPAAGVSACLIDFESEEVLSFADVEGDPSIVVNGWFSDVEGDPALAGSGFANVTEL